MERYNHLNNYLKNKFGERVLKICIDANFTCPNRDGSKGIGGCIFCGAKGAGENIKGKLEDTIASIKNQISTFLLSYRGQRANKFIVYFQAFSNTYASCDVLKKLYDIALSCDSRIVGLQVATRPDLINEDVCRLLHSYKDKYFVCVELGLQTANNNIGKVLNRCYDNVDYLNACKLLNKYEIEIVAHLMIGLPYEKDCDIINTVGLINKSGAKGIKIHNTYVLKNTKLESMYKNNEFEPITQEKYVSSVCRVIQKLNKDIIIHRITGDPSKDEFVAPLWATHKKLILNAINNELINKNIFQGEDKGENV